ncbi:hypothetical protein HYS03_00465 [Candidatus Woesebacteria bacterium]|nr:hypothetical protein [Candidatus Woesebacteria bacterium]QQG47637.1 MAG: hypothetical protein HY044_00945 [Candidatus Woesebacteria bacterium]
MFQIFGTITQPSPLAKFGSLESGGAGNFLNLIFKILVVGAGIYAVINIILAGYSFLSAGDDPKAIAGAWNKILQTLIGLAVVVGCFVLAAIFGILIYGDAGAILAPKIPTL